MPTQSEIKHYRNPFPTTDLIIEYCQGGKDGIVLIKRKNPPYGLALPGGFAEWGLSLEENARKEAREETGLEVIIEDGTHPFSVRSDPSRDPRGHMISVAYLVPKGNARGFLVAGDDAAGAGLYSLDEAADLVRNNGLAFDHGEIVKEYLALRGYWK